MADNQTLKGRTAIVTGASSGIGRAIAIRLGEAGAHVFLAGRTESALKEGVQAVEKAGGRATAIAFDARDVKQVQSLVDKAVKATGRLDIMVNNAGLEFPSAIIDGDPERWRQMVEGNVLSMLPVVLDKTAAAAKLFLASADDIARAALFAVTQPIELNIFEMVVRPQRQLQLPA